jgi:histidinol-phosphate aminotransferase
MLPEPRREVLKQMPAVHGGLDFEELRRLGLRAEEVLDFSTCTNPYGPSPLVRNAIAQVAIGQYPDRQALAFREALAESLGVSTSAILVGNGSSELIWLTALAFLRERDKVLVLGPTYGEYARAAEIMGACVTMLHADEERNFILDEEEINRNLNRLQPGLVFLSNPNNPVGTIIPPDVIRKWANAYPQTLFVVDEAYLAFAPHIITAMTPSCDNLLILRSMTKDYGLAGLRLGYAVGHEELIAKLARVQPPWSVNTLAQAAGGVALRDQNHLERSLNLVRRAKTELVLALAELGLETVPSAVHYFLVRVGDGAGFRASLLSGGILVRDCASFGLSEFVRIGTGCPQHNARLVKAIRELSSYPIYRFAPANSAVAAKR